MTNRVTIFDLDHTLLNSNCSFRFGFFLYRHRFFSFFNLIACLFIYARHKWLGLPIYELHRKVFVRLFKGQNQKKISELVQQFLDHSFDTMCNPVVVQRLRDAQSLSQCNHEVIILSSSPSFLVVAIAARFNVFHSSSTVYQCDDKGNFVAIEKVMEGEEKAQYLAEWMKKKQLNTTYITVYSDSHHDLPILKMAGTAIAVKPNKYLKSICLQKGWEIL